jgi:uncharacterized protein
MVSRKIIPGLIIVMVCNTFLWLDSLDQYLATRFHFYLTEYIPEKALTPSIELKKLLGVGDKKEPEFTRIETMTSKQKEAIESPLNPPNVISPAVIKKDEEAKEVVSDVMNVSDDTQLAMAKNNAANPSLSSVEKMKSPYASLPLKTGNIKVMFAGDSMMQGVAPIAINSLQKTYPKSQFVDQSKQSTGLTVKRYFDWPTKIKEGIAKENYKVIVIFLGPNDPWDIYENKKVYKFPSKEWEALYQERVEDVLSFAKEHGAQIIWIGLANMNEERLKTGAIIQNRVFKNETQKYGFQYISTEEIVGPLDQPYKAYIKDPVKGDVLMRGSDGIHFTPTALRLISQRVVNAIAQLDQE